MHMVADGVLSTFQGLFLTGRCMVSSVQGDFRELGDRMNAARVKKMAEG